MDSQPQPPAGILPLPDAAVEAIRRAYRAQEKAKDAHKFWVESMEALYRELEPVVLEVIGTGGEFGVTMSQVQDVVGARMGVEDFDIFPVCKELFRRELVWYRKERRTNRAGNQQVQSVQYLTELGGQVYRGEVDWP